MQMMIQFYNLNKGAADVADRMGSEYTVGRITNRWPMVVLYSMLDIIGINARVLYEINTGNEILRSQFLNNWLSAW